MRLLIALLSVLTMIAGPVLAGTGTACHCPPMAGPSATSPVRADAAVMPCCDPASKAHGGKTGGCAQSCGIVMPQAVTANVPSLDQRLGFAPVVFAAHPLLSTGDTGPYGFQRPPKSGGLTAAS